MATPPCGLLEGDSGGQEGGANGGCEVVGEAQDRVEVTLLPGLSRRSGRQPHLRRRRGAGHPSQYWYET